MADPHGESLGSTPSKQDDWPITIVARWTDPGYGEREELWWAIVLVAVLWSAAVCMAAGQGDARPILLSLFLGGAIAWRWARRRPSDIELVLEPDRLLVRETVGAAPSVQLDRVDAGWLFAAETGLDWTERRLVLTNRDGHELVRLRTWQAIVRSVGPADAVRSWWHLQVPAGQIASGAPSVLSVAALVGRWWPAPDRRFSVRGNLGMRQPWKEASLAGYDAWDRRQRRLNAGFLAGFVIVAYALVAAMAWPLTTIEVVAFLPPGVVGLILTTRAFVR